MKIKFLFLVIVGFNCASNKQALESNYLNGTYTSVNNAFEKVSTIRFYSDRTFTYKYALGGCQDEVTGTWDHHLGVVWLSLDREYDTVEYHVPNLNEVKLTV